jgi:hypothetical protein
MAHRLFPVLCVTSSLPACRLKQTDEKSLGVAHNIPDWVPLPFKKVAKKGREMLKRMQNWPWNETLRHYVSERATFDDMSFEVPSNIFLT